MIIVRTNLDKTAGQKNTESVTVFKAYVVAGKCCLLGGEAFLFVVHLALHGLVVHDVFEGEVLVLAKGRRVVVQPAEGDLI